MKGNMKYLIKFDYATAKGWQVKIENELLNITKFFSVSKHGSFAEAKEMALMYRNKVLKENNAMFLLDTKHYQTSYIKDKNIRNSSGVTGVTLSNWNGIETWKAYSDVNKEKSQAYFNDAVSGFIDACIQRAQWKGYLTVVNPSVMPCSVNQLKRLIKDVRVL